MSNYRGVRGQITGLEGYATLFGRKAKQINARSLHINYEMYNRDHIPCVNI